MSFSPTKFKNSQESQRQPSQLLEQKPRSEQMTPEDKWHRQLVLGSYENDEPEDQQPPLKPINLDAEQEIYDYEV